MAEVSKRLTEQYSHNDLILEFAGKQSKSETSQLPKASRGRSPQSPVSLPNSLTTSPKVIAPQLPKKIPRPVKRPAEEKTVEIPVGINHGSPPANNLTMSQTREDINSPAPQSSETFDPLVIIPVTLSNPAIPTVSPRLPKEAPKVDAKSTVKSQTQGSHSLPFRTSRRPDKKEYISNVAKRESIPQSSRSFAKPFPAMIGIPSHYHPIHSKHVQRETHDRYPQVLFSRRSHQGVKSSIT